MTDEADELYGLAPGDFTSERDELVKRLRKDGRRDEANAVKALRKPTTPAWALNQVARGKPRDVTALLNAGKKLREAHEALLAGGDRKALRSASEKERELVARLVREAAAVADAEGVATTAAFRERVESTLRAAATDEELGAELRAGRLAREREVVGLFGESAGAPEAQPKRRPKQPAETEPDPDLERALREARKEDQRAQRAREKAAKATQAAEKRAADAKRRADEARANAEEAVAALRAAKADEAEAAKLQRRTARAVTTAEKEAPLSRAPTRSPRRPT